MLIDASKYLAIIDRLACAASDEHVRLAAAIFMTEIAMSGEEADEYETERPEIVGDLMQ